MTMPLLSLRSVGIVDDRGARPRTVLSDISFDLRAGEQFGIWGARRSGKTTLLNVAAGRLAPHSGSVCFMGRDMAEMSDGELADLRRREIGWVQRTPPQLEMPLLDWIAYSAPEDASYRRREREAADLLERMGIEHERFRLRWSELSDGERALAGIANALVRKPRLLIADDPTTALDAGERDRVTLMLRLLAEEQQIGMLMGAPDMGTLRYVKRFASLSDSGLTEAEVKDEPGPQAEVISIHERRGAAGQ
jgi:ABC-type lipoprotein export system ATPase subunit